MHYQFDGYNYLVRLDKGERLVERLSELIANGNIQGAWVSGIGAASWVELGYYHHEKHEYQWRKLEQSLEIVSLQGNAAWHENKPFLHLHGVLSDVEMKTYGGHVRELEVTGTCEIFLHLWNKDTLSRRPDSDTGLKLLGL